MRAPDYTVADLVYWTGFIGACSVTVLALQLVDVHHLIRLACGVVAGVAAGAGATALYRASRRPPHDVDGPGSRDGSDRN